MSQTAAHLVDHVIPHVPVRQWVLSLPIPLRVLLAAQPELVTPALQVVQRVVARHLLEAAGLKAEEGHGGAVTLIQRFGSAANLNIHLHCLVLDGVYRCDADGLPSFIEVGVPSDDELHALLQTVIARLMKMLTRRGVLVEEMGQTYLADPDADGEEARTLRPLQAAAVTYRIAFGLRAGQRVLTLRGATPRETAVRQPLCADIDGFSLHAAVRCEAHDRNWLGTSVPLHHATGAFRRAGADQCRRTGGAEAQDAVARRHHAPRHVAAGVHAAAGGAGAATPAAPDPLSRGAGPEREAAASGGAARPTRASTGGHRG